MVLDLIAIQAEIAARQQTIERRLGGGKNMSEWDDLSEQEKANVTTLSGEYEEWRRVFALGEQFINQLMKLGYPVMPTMTVPPSMIATVKREQSETEEFGSLFTAEVLATKMNVIVSPPRKQ